MSYYNQLFSSLKSLNPGTRYFINQVFNRKQCCYMEEMISLLRRINEKEESVRSLTREEMLSRTREIRESLLSEDKNEKDLLVDSFALVRETARRTLNMRHFDVQILGGIALHRGNIAEMTTGEGKTLVATLPLFFNALRGKGCHLVTVNDYLAKRDTQWMGPIFHYLGLTIGSIISFKEAKGPYSATAFVFDPAYMPADSRFLYLRPATRQEAYKCDITYGVGSEFGFDYLRDNMAIRQASQVQRKLYFAIIDEVDSILIDEARTPLIISGPSEEAPQMYYEIDRLVRKLNRDTDYTVEEEGQTVTLSDQGIQKCERLMSIQNLYDGANTERVHHINQALRAHTFFKRDKEYIVKDGQVIIVDEFTGRLMPGRRWSDGLHQAIEAKEGVKIESENQTLATISFQNYFKLYDKIAGMTGTALTEAVEFKEIYKVDVVAIPTNKNLSRTEFDDEIYQNERDKFNAIVAAIEELHRLGRPVLVGTISIEKAELLSRFLQRKNIPHQVLHGKNHEAEAAIIAQTGRPGAVTIATQMAGRGVDIILGGNPEILAREETIRVIWEKKGARDKAAGTGTGKAFASVLNEIEDRYKHEVSSIDQKFGHSLAELKKSLDLKGAAFEAVDKKARNRFEEAVFTNYGAQAYKRYEPRLTRLREIHEKAAEDLLAAQVEFKDHPEKLKDLKEHTGRTFREYNSFRAGLKSRFNITADDDLEALRNKFTEILNRTSGQDVEHKKDLLASLEAFRKGLSDYLELIETVIPDKGGNLKSPSLRKKAAAYISLLDDLKSRLVSGEEGLREILARFRDKDSSIYYSLLEDREEKERQIKASLIEEDYNSLSEDYRKALSLYEEEQAKYDKELSLAREAYEQERNRHESEWQKAREELEKTPEEFAGLYEQLLEKYKKPWMESHVKVIEAGGLHVIGSERYEARRIDNQLKGRAGRQGDPGSSHFYLSLDDDLLRIFGSERMAGIMGKLPEGETIKHPLINKMINNAQKKVEARNFEIRKQLIEFDNVLNEQRQIIYSLRQDILEGRNVDGYIEDYIETSISEISDEAMNLQVKPFQWNLENVKMFMSATFGINLETPDPESITNPAFWKEDFQEKLTDQVKKLYGEKKNNLGNQVAEIQKFIFLQVIDNRWKAHLRVIDELREGISLRAYAQRDPLIAYKHEGYQAFQEMLASIKTEILSYLFKIQVSQDSRESLDSRTTKAPSQVVYDHKSLGQFDGLSGDRPAVPNIPDQSVAGREAQVPAGITYTRETQKVGRNEPCPCGSGKKYKRCCGKDV